MNITQNDYDVKVTVNDAHARSLTRVMVKKIVEDLFRDLGLLDLSGIIIEEIRMREYDLTVGDNPSWQADLSRNTEFANGTKLSFNAQQFYKAFHKTNHDFDYFGSFTVTLVFSNTGIVGISSAVAEVISSLAHTHYRGRIYHYFPDWETDYVDKILFYEVPAKDQGGNL